MMELQKVFKKSYMEDLRRNIQISDYQGETFPFDPSKVRADALNILFVNICVILL